MNKEQVAHLIVEKFPESGDRFRCDCLDFATIVHNSALEDLKQYFKGTRYTHIWVGKKIEALKIK